MNLGGFSLFGLILFGLFSGFGFRGTGWAAQPPVITISSSLTIKEDSGQTNVAFTVTDADSDLANVTITPTSSNSNVVPTENLVITGSGSSRTLEITSLTNSFGTASIQLTASDGQTNRTATLVLTVSAVNDAPSFTLSTNEVTIAEDASLTLTNFVTALSAGPTNEVTQSLSFTLTTTNKSFFATQPTINSARTLSLKPAANVNGAIEISVVIQDSGGSSNDGTNRSAPQTFNLVVSAVNDGPALTMARTLTLNEDNGTTNVAFTVSDVDGTLAGLTIVPHSTDQTLVPDDNLAIIRTDGAASGSLIITPLANAFGKATIQLIATDAESAITTNLLALTINPVNDIPNFTLSTEAITGVEDVAVKLTNFVTSISLGPTNEIGQAPLFLVTTTNRSFFAVQPAIDSTGALVFKPAPDGTGETTVSVVLQDRGGTASGGIDKTLPQDFRITITPSNDAPALRIASSLKINEDSGSTNISFMVTDVDSDLDNVTITPSSSNAALVPATNLVVSGTGTNRTLTITPLPDISGVAVIQLTAQDDGGAQATAVLSLTVNEVNDAPSFTLSTNVVTVAEDTALILTNFVASADRGSPNESKQSLTYLVTTTNKAFFSVLPTISSTGTLNFKPASNADGSTTVNVVLQDNGGISFGGTNKTDPQSFTITVTAVDDAPAISLARTLSINEDSGTTNISFKVTDVDTAADNIQVAVVSSNPDLVPNANLVLGTTGTNRNLSITPLTNANGIASIQLTATDGVASATVFTFLLTVNPVNDPPRFSLSTNRVMAAEDASLILPNFVTDISAGPSNEITQAYTFLVTTSDRSFFTLQPTITPKGTLSFKPAANKTGTNELQVVLQDNAGISLGGTNKTAPQTFSVVVAPENDAPALSIVKTLKIKEDSGPTNLAFVLSDVDGSLDDTTLTLISSNPAVVPNDNLQSSGTGTNRTLTITPLTNAFGTATIQLTATDGQSANTTTLSLVVSPVNDAPSFTLATNLVTVAEDTSLTLTNFATNLSPGPENEAKQALTFLLNTTNRSFFKVQPAINSSGTLSFKPADNKTGTNEITVVLQDSAGVELGGVNKSPPQTFSIVVTEANDAPTFTVARGLFMNEDSGTTNFTFKIADVDGASGDVSVSATSSNPTLVPDVNLVVSGTGTNRTLAITPLTNAFGSATIRLAATDTAATNTTTFALTVSPVNDPPSFVISTNQVVVAEDAFLSLTNFVASLSTGPTNEASQGLLFLLTTTNRAFYASQPAINSAGTLLFKPASNVTGTNEVTVVLQDTGGTTLGGTNKSAPQTFNIVVAPVNDAPAISISRTVVMVEDAGTTNLSFKVSDVDGESGPITVAAKSSNAALIPDSNIETSGTGTNRTLSLTLLTNAFGTATITLTATDESSSSSTNTVSLFVSAVNDRPSFSLSTNEVTVGEDTLLVLTNFAANISLGPTNEAGQGFLFLLTPADKSLFATQPSINSVGTLVLKPAANVTGTNLVSVVLQDNGGALLGGTNRSEVQSFSVIVTATNDPPTITVARSLSVNEDAGETNLSFTVTDVDSPVANIAITATSSNTNLIANTNLVVTVTDGVGKITFTPLPDANGQTTFTLIATDDQAAKRTNLVAIAVNSVNEAPSFTLSTNLVAIAKNAGLIRLTNFVTNISAGPTNEAKQGLIFIVTTADTSLFTSRPTISSAGLLIFKTTTNASGTLPIDVVLQDTGGSLFGGTNRSATQSFGILISSETTLAMRKIQPTQRASAAAAFLVSRPETEVIGDLTTVYPRITDEVLPNPFKGLVTTAAEFTENPMLPQSLVYADITWEALEPARGVFNWDALEAGWERHTKLGRRVGFRIKLADPWVGGHADIPAWLVEAGVPLHSYSVEGSAGWAPDWDDELLLEEHDRMISDLGRRYNSDPRIAWVDVGSYGLWGTWHLFGNEALTAQPGSKTRILTAYLRAFPDKQLALPYEDDSAARFLTAYGGGLRNDFLGFPRENTCYLESLNRIQPGLNEWLFKRAAIIGEFGNGEAGALEALSDRFDDNLEFIRQAHWSWIGPAGGSLINPRTPALRAKAETLYKTLGYRFAVSELTHESSLIRGQTLHLAVKILNQGVAPFYYWWPVEIALIGAAGQPALALNATTASPAWDPRAWLPGSHELFLNVVVPETAAPGEYQIALAILDPATSTPGIRFANETRRPDGRYSFSVFEVRENSDPAK